jgi:pimeloyl-ACP methyl ester carboxylesterase
MPTADVNGVRLYYELRGEGQAPVVVLHGAQGDARLMEGMVPWLEGSYRVLLFDQRGLGRSEKPDVEYSAALLADDTAALMELVDFGRAQVIGISMGGMIAQELALRHPERLISLVLGCTSAGGPRALQAVQESPAYATRQVSPEERARLLAESIYTPRFIQEHPEAVEALLQLRRQAPLDTVGFRRRMEALQRHDTYDRLGAIRCPTLVITGALDRLIPAENSRILARRIPGAELVVLEGLGHGFWREAPEESLSPILRFLARYRAGV